MPMQAEEVTYAVQEQSEGDDLAWITCVNRDSEEKARAAVELFQRRCSPRRFRVLRISKVTTIDVVETFAPSRKDAMIRLLWDLLAVPDRGRRD